MHQVPQWMEEDLLKSLSRENKVDHTLGGEAAKDFTSWSAAIISSADKVQVVDEDGWSTSVKPKKKNSSKSNSLCICI